MMHRLRGLLALLIIVGVTVGLPFALLAFGGNPFAGELSSLGSVIDLLTSRDDGTLFLLILQLAGWLAWAFLALTIVVELLAQIRGVRAPRIRGLSLPQNAARSLVGTALLLFTAVPMAQAATAAAPAVAETAHIQTVTTVSAPAQPVETQEHTKPGSDAPAETKSPSTVEHTVVYGDNLWKLAETYLGDGHRFREIVALNKGKLADRPADLTIGWVLQIPAEERSEKADEPARPAKDVVVQRGDTLSEIAADELGDSSRYPEIFEASKDIDQPGGAHLTDPNLVRPGWTVQVPGTKPAQVENTGAPASSPKPGRSSAPSSVSSDMPADAGQAGTAEELPDQAPDITVVPESAVDRDAQEPPAAAAPAPAPPAQTQAPSTPQETAPAQNTVAQSDDGLSEEFPWQVATIGGIGTVLAAGVLGLVAHRRRETQRRRNPGQAMPMPAGPAAEFEQQIRAAADSLAVETVDAALRSLARQCAESAQALPVVRAGRLTANTFELYLEEPAQLPPPWSDMGGSTIWKLEVGDSEQIAPVSPHDVPAPYPALVTIGNDEEQGHVFLNLEHLGSLGITGDDQGTREILAALAVELATSVWADDLQVTLVGAFPELEDALRTGRIRYLPTVGRLTEELAQRADADRRALADAGAPDLYTARVTGAAPDTWYPEIVLLAGEIPERQRSQLAELVDQAPHVAMATITSGACVGDWSLDISTSSDLAVLSPNGLHLRPQRLPWEQYGHLLEVVSLTDVEELEGVGPDEPAVAEVEAIAPIDDDPGPASAMPPVTLAMLEGPGDDLATSTIAVTSSTAELTGVSLTTPDSPGDPQGNHEPSKPNPWEHAVLETRDGAEVGQQASSVQTEEVKSVETPSAPQILVLGPIDMTNASGNAEPSKRARLLEYAAFLVLHPGATHTALDDAIWPDRTNEDNMSTRNTATSKLRRWVGRDPEGEEYLPRNPAGIGYAFAPAVTSDADVWDRLMNGNPLNASTEDLEQALMLVRGIPFAGTHRKRYAWAEPIKQRLISEIVDASYALGKRRLMEGRWRAAEKAVVVGLAIEPAQENLWRIRILAAHESRNPDLEARTIDGLLTITERLECDLEPETDQLLTALKNPGADFDRLMAHAL